MVALGISLQLPRFLECEQAARFPRNRPVRCRWRKITQSRFQKGVDVLPSGLCYPHSAVLYTKRAHRKKIASCGQVGS